MNCARAASLRSPNKRALAKLAFVGLQQRLLSSIAAFFRTLKAHRKTLQRLIDGEDAQGISAAAEGFVDGSTTDKTEDLGLEDQSAEAAIEADEEATAEAASISRRRRCISERSAEGAGRSRRNVGIRRARRSQA